LAYVDKKCLQLQAKSIVDKSAEDIAAEFDLGGEMTGTP
jgi:hypothetical protein